MPMHPAFEEIRRRAGHLLLWIPGVTAVVLRDGADGPEVLLVQRADDHEWTPITGMIDPGEDVDTAAIRETLEEAEVSVVVERVLWIQALPPVTYANGDIAQYYDTAVLCRTVGGEAAVGDEESVAVGWFPVDAMPVTSMRMRRQIEYAVSGDRAVRIGPWQEGRHA